jgi:hypothetical protein
MVLSMTKVFESEISNYLDFFFHYPYLASVAIIALAAGVIDAPPRQGLLVDYYLPCAVLLPKFLTIRNYYA